MPVVVSLHLEEERLGLSGLAVGNQGGVQKLQDVLADPAELLLHGLLVFLDYLNVILVSLK